MVSGVDKGPAWDMEIDNRRPFVGDLVVIRVSSLYANEDAHIEVKHNGSVVRNIWVRTGFNKSVNVKWQTTLEATPGTYRLCLIYLGVEEVFRNIILVFDPLDYAMKSIARLEREIIRLDYSDDRTEGWALLALRRIDYYLYRWVAAGLIVNVLAIGTLFYLGPIAYRKYVLNAARKGLRGAIDWEPNVDGHLIGQMGKETMRRTKAKMVPEPGYSRWCEKCQVLVHKAEWDQHDHKEEEASEWEEMPKEEKPKKARKVIPRRVRVIKRRVVVTKPHVDILAQEMD